jgi:hypothetical protein
MKISREISQVQIIIDQKTTEEYLKHLGSMMINDARRTRGIKPVITMAHATSNRKQNFLSENGT